MNRSRKELKKPKGAEIVTGIAWYSSDQWADLRRVVSDPDTLEPTYEEWQDVVRRTIPDLLNQGMKLVKVPVDVTELVKWCRHHGLAIDGDARAQYVVEALRQLGPSSFESFTKQT